MIAHDIGAAFDAAGATWRLVDRARAHRVCGVSTDTRTAAAGDLFFALRGPTFDASAFVQDAAERGVSALVMEDRDDHRERLAELHATYGLAVAVVPDAVAALGAFACAARAALPSRVLAITGSCGKTSTKRIVDTLLSASCRTAASPASFNNAIGVPHTVFLATEDTDVLIAEIGTNGPGEIRALAAIARPDVALITNIGRSHLERLGSVEGVADEKAELLRSLDPSSERAAAVVNLDDPMTPRLQRALAPGVPVVTFSACGDSAATFHATAIEATAAGVTFDLHGPTEALGAPVLPRVSAPLLGRHAVANILAALGAVHALGADVRAAVGALGSLRAAPHRLSPGCAAGVHVIDDTYNANPLSMAAAVELLGSIDARRFLVLGAMCELGDGALQMHRELGRAAAAAGVERLVLVAAGDTEDEMDAVRDGAAALGRGRVVVTSSIEEAVAVLGEHVRPGDVVLVKASRSQRLERVVDGLVAALAPAEESDRGAGSGSPLATGVGA